MKEVSYVLRFSRVDILQYNESLVRRSSACVVVISRFHLEIE